MKQQSIERQTVLELTQRFDSLRGTHFACTHVLESYLRMGSLST
jgi:hypothetical protein